MEALEENSELTLEKIEEKRKSKHYNMLYTYLTTGMSNQELGNMFDMNVANVAHIKQTSLWKQEEDLLREELQKHNKVKIAALVPSAISTIKNIMDDDTNSPTSRVNAAGKALEIAEYGKASKGNDKGGSVVNISLARPGWAKGEGGEGDTINVQVNVGG